jgi:hypothetical protein
MTLQISQPAIPILIDASNLKTNASNLEQRKGNSTWGTFFKGLKVSVGTGVGAVAGVLTKDYLLKTVTNDSTNTAVQKVAKGAAALLAAYPCVITGTIVGGAVGILFGTIVIAYKIISS